MSNLEAPPPIDAAIHSISRAQSLRPNRGNSGAPIVNIRLPISCIALLIAMALPVSVSAQTYVIPFSEIRQAVESSGDSPDSVIRAYLAGRIRDELDSLGFDVSGGLVMGDIPIEEITEVIETNCNFPQPYVVHTDATTATVTIADSSSLTLNLDSIRSISLQAELTGTVSTAANAWVRWGQDVPFGNNCATISTDHGWVGLDLPFNIGLELALDLVPSYDNNLLALVVPHRRTWCSAFLKTNCC